MIRVNVKGHIVDQEETKMVSSGTFKTFDNIFRLMYSKHQVTVTRTYDLTSKSEYEHIESFLQVLKFFNDMLILHVVGSLGSKDTKSSEVRVAQLR